MSTYTTVDGRTRTDFRFNKEGVYHNTPARTSAAPTRFDNYGVRIVRHGNICPSCGLQRSRANKCECNS